MKFILLFCALGLALGFEDKTIAEYLRDNGFNTLYTALSTSGLIGTLDGSGPFTIFAPRDPAFVGVNLTAFTREQLASRLKYHVIPQFVLAPMITKPTVYTTLESQNITLEKSGANVGINSFATVDAGNNDIIVRNGVVQPIDKLLSPPVLATHNLFQVLTRESQFNEISLAMLLAGLEKTLESSEFTLFAPTNAAFESHADRVLNRTKPNPTLFREIMKYHLVPGGRRSSQLTDGQEMYTLHGTPLNVTVGSVININNRANVVDANIVASNGFVHAIDEILVPQDIAQLAQQG